MNRTFQEHVTNVAFMLSMSKKQIDLLLLFEQEESMRSALGYGHFVPTARSLEKKGLIVHNVCQEKITPAGFKHWSMTKAGFLVCAMLREAGFSSVFVTNKELAA